MFNTSVFFILFFMILPFAFCYNYHVVEFHSKKCEIFSCQNFFVDVSIIGIHLFAFQFLIFIVYLSFTSLLLWESHAFLHCVSYQIVLTIFFLLNRSVWHITKNYVRSQSVTYTTVETSKATWNLSGWLSSILVLWSCLSYILLFIFLNIVFEQHCFSYFFPLFSDRCGCSFFILYSDIIRSPYFCKFKPLLRTENLFFEKTMTAYLKQYF